MADSRPITPSTAWNHLVAERDWIINNLETSTDRNHTQVLDRRLALVEEQLLKRPAPDLDGVLTKLELIWAEQLHGEDEESRQKLLVFADLVRLMTT